MACENARRIAEDPEILKSARRHLDRFSRDDPHQRHGYALWSALLDEGSGTVIARLTERSERGDYARQTAPSFGGLDAATRARLLMQARSPLAQRDDLCDHAPENETPLSPDFASRLGLFDALLVGERDDLAAGTVHTVGGGKRFR